jgi:hypothetical protein
MSPEPIIPSYNLRENWIYTDGSSTSVATLGLASGAKNLRSELQMRGDKLAYGLVDEVPITVPLRCRARALQSIRIVDESDLTVKSEDPSLAVAAITVEYEYKRVPTSR